MRAPSVAPPVAPALAPSVAPSLAPSLAPTTEALAAIDARELFVRHAPFVARFLARLGVRAQELDDLVQEVFLVAHRHGGFVPGPGKATTWLAQIAIRVTSNARRSARRRREELGDEALSDLPTAGATPLGSLETHEALGRVQRALGALDLDHRAVFILFEIEGEPCDVIAQGLGIPVGTVHSRLFAARKAFARAYERAERAGAPPRARAAVTRPRQDLVLVAGESASEGAS